MTASTWLNWMAWTMPTAIFFIVIGMIIVSMTIWETVQPCQARKGFLPLTTTRGDRLFISLLISAFIHLLIIGATSWSIWVALGISICLLVITLIWG